MIEPKEIVESVSGDSQTIALSIAFVHDEHNAETVILRFPSGWCIMLRVLLCSIVRWSAADCHHKGRLHSRELAWQRLDSSAIRGTFREEVWASSVPGNGKQ